MQLGGALRDEAAVSTVISVVLVLAITVILATVVGVFAFGFEEPQESAPGTEFEYEKIERPSGHDEVRITHANGDSVQNTHLYIASDQGVRDADGSPSSNNRLTWYQLAEDDGATKDEALSVGDEVQFETQAPDIENVEVRIVWQPGPEQQSAILDRWATR